MPFRQRMVTRYFNEKSSHISVMFSYKTPISFDEFNNICEKIATEYLQTQDLQTDSSSGYLASAHFDFGDINLSTDRRVSQATLTVTVGDFFQITPIPLVSGSFFWGDDSYTDLAVIDENLAWQLFGSSEVSGMKFYAGDHPFVVSGVVRESGPFASETVYGSKPRIFMSWKTFLKWRENHFEEIGDSTAKEFAFSSLQLLLPEPVENAASKWLTESLERDGKQFYFVEDAEYFSFISQIKVLISFHQRGICFAEMDPPYWESAAFIAENQLAISLLASVFFLCRILFLVAKSLIMVFRS